MWLERVYSCGCKQFWSARLFTAEAYVRSVLQHILLYMHNASNNKYVKKFFKVSSYSTKEQKIDNNAETFNLVCLNFILNGHN